MWEIVIFAIAGALGGLVRQVITGEGILPLPKVSEGKLDLGFTSALIIGAFAGWLAPYSLGVDSVIAGLAGYAGQDAIENILERVLKHRGE